MTAPLQPETAPPLLTPRQLVKRARRLELLLGVELGLLVAPLDFLVTFALLGGSEPGLLGRHAVVLCGPILLGLVAARSSKQTFRQALALVTAVVLALAVGVHVERGPDPLVLVVVTLLIIWVMAPLMGHHSELGRLRADLLHLKALALPRVSRLGARSRQLEAAIGVGFALCLVPIYFVATFWFLGQIEPRAVGTYAFLVGGPIVLALIVARLSKHGPWGGFALTTATVLVLTAALHAIKLEQGICIVLVMLPIVSLAGLTSILANRTALRKVTTALGAKTISLLLVLLPAGALIEQRWAEVASPGQISRAVLISAEPGTIWQGIVRVERFSEADLPRTWLQELGIPRPVQAKVERVEAEQVRVGYFEGGLRFVERFTTFLPPSDLGLSVEPDESSLGKDDAARHAFSQGFLHIDEVRYRLVPEGAGTRLSLTCRYTVKTTLTGYAHAVANVVVGQFERDLLHALKVRFEKRSDPNAPRLAVGSPRRE